MSKEQDGILEAQANLTIDALKHILTSKDAIVLSPYSLILSMAISYIGARGETETEFKNLLSPHAGKEEYCRMLKNSIDGIHNDLYGRYGIYIANRIFLQNDYAVEEKFKYDIKNYLAASLENLDFNDREKSVKIINDFISNATNHKIKNLIRPNSFSMDTRAIIISALYFKCQWNQIFCERLTVDDEFHITKSEKKIVKMMNNRSLLIYGGDNDFHAVKMQYWNCTEFFLILPKEKNKLHSLLKKMDGKGLLKLINSANCYKSVILSMPKFKVESSHNMKNVLTKMGLSTPFNENANFTGITSTEEIWVDDIIQKVFIDVNEKGTEAAAAVILSISGCGSLKEYQEEVIVKADHPFLYVILNKEKILFCGVYQ
uniref:SERPIN domain-containing protein n=1 Tax=Strongyloides papillosus TaxID=174720 RepID=A0A0N5CH52_STREA